MFKKLSNIMNKSSNATLPKAVAPAQERKPLAPLPPQQRNGSYTNEDFSDTASGDSSLEGNIQLRVLLPDGTSVFMAVERRMPMMDLLVHIATAHKLSPGNHQINVVNAQDNILSYKASTPIGSLNTSSVQLVPKRNDVPSKKMPKQVQPFEQTFRLQVHLPRQQLFVIRVSPHARLADIFSLVCQQKELDPNRYLLQHPTSNELQLDLNRSLADYSLTEINVISKRGSVVLPSRVNANVEYRSAEPDEKKSKNLFGIKFRRTKSSVGDSHSDECDGRSSSAINSVDLRPKSEIVLVPSKKAMKKRAPPPPSTKPNGQGDRPPPPPPLHSKTSKNHQNNEQSHSRHSSDSSGYHESSVIGDECPEIETARSTSNLSSTASTSTTSIVSGIKKRRAPPPPMARKTEKETRQPEPSTSRVNEAIIDTTTEDFSQSLPLISDSSSPETPPPNAPTSPEPILEIVSSAELPPSDDRVFDDITEEPILERECHDQSLPPTTSHENPTLACDGIDLSKQNFSFDVPDITIDKYREEETSGSCSRSDTHTTDSAVADLDLDASGSTSWSPIPDIKPSFSKEIRVTVDVHCEESHIIEEMIEDFVIKDNDESPKVEFEEMDDKYDWFSSNRTIGETNHDDWIKSSSEDEHETLEAPSTPSSYYSVDDIAASFEQVIADAESAMKRDLEEEKRRNTLDDMERNEMKTTLDLQKIIYHRTRPLVNFSIDTYKSRNNDNDPSELLGYSEPEPKSELNPIKRSSSMSEKNVIQNIQFKMAPYDNTEKQIDPWESEEPKKNLATKSKSMMNLVDDEMSEFKKTKSVEKMNSVDSNSTLQPDNPEYIKLHEEYMKFQQQLIYWQQQLMSNQALLQQQHIVPPDMGLAPEIISSFPVNLEKQNSLSVNNIDEPDNKTFSTDQQKAKSWLDLSPQPLTKPKPIIKPIVKVESMKSEDNFVDFSEPEVIVKEEPQSVLPSIKDRINLFGKKYDSSQEVKKNDENMKPSNFERGLLARKPIKISNSSNTTNSDKQQGFCKFRRQRIVPNNLDSEDDKKEINTKPICNGHVVKDKPVAIAQVRKPKQSRPLIFTYFGDSVNEKGSFKTNPEDSSPTRSVITKIATNEVLDKPNLPLPPPANWQNPIKNEKKIGNGNVSNSKKPLNKFATAPSSRDLLLDSIRDFGGRNKLRKVPKSETYWHSWHGEVA